MAEALALELKLPVIPEVFSGCLAGICEETYARHFGEEGLPVHEEHHEEYPGETLLASCQDSLTAEVPNLDCVASKVPLVAVSFQEVVCPLSR